MATNEREAEVAASIRERYFGMLLEHVRNDTYPSSKMLEMLEEGLQGPELEDLADVLLEKTEQDRYPSLSMLNRIARITRQAQQTAVARAVQSRAAQDEGDQQRSA